MRNRIVINSTQARDDARMLLAALGVREEVAEEVCRRLPGRVAKELAQDLMEIRELDDKLPPPAPF